MYLTIKSLIVLSLEIDQSMSTLRIVSKMTIISLNSVLLSIVRLHCSVYMYLLLAELQVNPLAPSCFSSESKNKIVLLLNISMLISLHSTYQLVFISIKCVLLQMYIVHIFVQSGTDGTYFKPSSQ